MVFTDQSVMEIADRALGECSTAAEVRYVAKSMDALVQDNKARRSLADLVNRHLTVFTATTAD
ncbi:MAG: hypothetical protein U1D30_09910 [Planctomycetota bacterium]